MVAPSIRQVKFIWLGSGAFTDGQKLKKRMMIRYMQVKALLIMPRIPGSLHGPHTMGAAAVLVRVCGSYESAMEPVQRCQSSSDAAIR